MPIAFISSIGPLEIVLLGTAFLLSVIPACRICARAGFPWQAGLLVLVPGINVLLPLIFAFIEWPALRREGEKPAPPDRLLD